jgi:hypothetical protein
MQLEIEGLLRNRLAQAIPDVAERAGLRIRRAEPAGLLGKIASIHPTAVVS